MGKPRKRSSSNNAATAAATAGGGSAAGPSSPSRQQQQQQQQQQLSSNNSMGSAPSSVMCVPAPLARELSDLSGSYMNGNTAPRGFSGRASVNSTDHEPVQGFWRQAYILSNPCPQISPANPPPPPAAQQVQQQHQQQQQQQLQSQGSASALIVVERNGVIELVKKSDSGGDDHHEQQQGTHPQSPQGGAQSHNHKKLLSKGSNISHEELLFLSHTSPSSLFLSADNNNNNHHHGNGDDEMSRIPILILLLDPGRKQYEIMQLWVDPQSDLARDVLYALQRKLSDRWRQDYDGLFQLRGDKFCQLVHILSISKYDVRPRELWVAKPWSMAAKAATDFARDCIRQLRAGGLLDLYPTSNAGKSRIKNFLRKGSKEGRTSPVFETDVPLTLSEEAMKRIYCPNELKHHHAAQFLSFRVPSIPSRVPVHSRSGNSQPGSNGSRGFLGSLLGTSQSFDDVSSQLSNPSDVMLLPSNPDMLRITSSFSTSSPATSPSRRQRQQQQPPQYTPPFAAHQYNNLSSQWKPSGPLEVVGEFIVASNNNADTQAQQSAQQPDNNASTILADLKGTTTTKEKSDPKQQFEDELEAGKKQRCSIWNYLSPLNCVKRRASGKGDDGYSSSWGGDGSRSSGSKNNRSRRSSSNNNNNNNNAADVNGRETPTSKGSHDDEQSFKWDQNGWKEDTSIISDSAPLLTTRITCTTNLDPGPAPPRPEQAKTQPSQARS